ncbi:hypothetical protein AB1Y20_005309 [Prymnesium parvum]|uniref:Uncharacterized protein n=1 Tax=Prymnesium parvum TaxID=97485 RepID=A0AB34J5G2_PRYPA
MSTVVFAGISFDLPEGVTVAIAGDTLRLSFVNYTGSLSISGGQTSPCESSQPAKRTRFETPEEKKDEECRGASDQHTTMMHHTEVFRNGGLSQADSEEDSLPPEPRSISWDDVVMEQEVATHLPSAEGDTSEAAVEDEWAAAMDEDFDSTLVACPSDFPSNRSPLRASRTNATKAAEETQEPSSRPECHPSSSLCTSPSPLKAGKTMQKSTPSQVASHAGSDAAEEAEVAATFPFSRAAPLDAWEWQKVEVAGTKPKGRWAHSAVALAGSMYVFGGDELTEEEQDDGGVLCDLHRFDSSTRAWTRLRDAPQRRTWHTGTVLGGSVHGDSDILLVFGGETVKEGSRGKRQATNTMLSYDPEFEVWYDAVDRGHRPSARYGHSSCLHTCNGKGSKLLVFGGVGAGGRKFAEPELHELHISADWSWKRALSAGKPPFARAYHSATPISEGRVLLFGGNDTDCSFKDPHVLELHSMTWYHPDVKGEPPLPRTGHVAVCLDGLRVLIHGGWDYAADEDEGYDFRSDVAILDTDEWQWSRPKISGKGPSARVGHSMVPLSIAEGRSGLYLFGGRDEEDEALDDLYILQPTDTEAA